jgi:hypothetical protein
MINSLFVDHPVIKDQLETFVVHVRRVDDFSARNNLRSWKFGCRSFKSHRSQNENTLTKGSGGSKLLQIQVVGLFFYLIRYTHGMSNLTILDPASATAPWAV